MSSPPASGRKRRPASDPGSSWASLPKDLLGVVASRLLAGDLLDYVRFRAVCSSWRSGTDEPRGRGVSDPRFHPRRWMMLPEGHCLYPGHPNLDGYVRFLNLDTGAMVRSRIPLLGPSSSSGFSSSCPTDRGFWVIDSVDGLLLLLRDPDPQGAVRLLHPFTGDIAELPPLGALASCLDSYPATYRARRLCISLCASVSFDTAGAMTVMLALPEVRRIAFATSLDHQWTLSTWEWPFSSRTLSFQGKLYGLNTPCPWGQDQEKIHQVLQVDPPTITQDDGGLALPQPKLIATIPGRNSLDHFRLVECDSEILVLGRNDVSVPQIVVFKLADLVLQRFIPIEGIGGNTLFIGERNIRVSSGVLPTAKGDNVVYQRPTPPYLEQYNLSSRSLSPAIDTCSLYAHVPGPSNLILYVFSCCVRNQWSRGIVFRKEAENWSIRDEEEQV